LTPGDTLDVTKADICARGYTKLVRDVPAAVKREAYAKYGLSKKKGKCCEVDHLIPLEFGGSNRLKNLWPEPYDIG
jgi:5-methylcytosine-specific restriction endonuclease McrA